MNQRDALISAADAALAAHDVTAAAAKLGAFHRANPNDTEVTHWLALLRREQDRREDSIDLLRDAVALEPGDVGLAYALAQVMVEAGRPNVAAFENAVRLAPGRADIHLGLAGARLAAGDGSTALDGLERLLAGNPYWIEGHRQYAQLASFIGHSASPLATLQRAISAHPQIVSLHHAAVQLLLDAERFEEAREAARRGLANFASDRSLLLGEAAATDELSELAAARAMFDRLGVSADHAVLVRRARHLLRSGEAVRVSAELDNYLAAEGAETLWPYAALAWRASRDRRSDWLEDRPGLVTTVDLDLDSLQLERLRQLLDGLHAGAGRFFDQSMRGGSQTNGALFSRIDPEIAQLRELIRSEVSRHISGFGSPEFSHPTLSCRRDRPIRFSGSWSVRLKRSGFHAAHHHPQGWLSSAFYVAVPPKHFAGGTLEIGTPPANMGLDFAPRHLVEPCPGRLIIFPSWSWHATRPFSNGERMTVAFDVARP